MVDVVLDNIAPDEAALKSPDRERWCKGVSRSAQGYYCCGDCYTMINLAHGSSTPENTTLS